MDSTTISLFTQIFRGTGRDAINGQKKGGAKAHTVIKADEDVPFFVNITDATVSDQSLLKGLFRILPRGSWLSFDMGYVNYEAWQEFTDNDIFYVTKEKKRTKAKVLETKDIPEEDKDTIVDDEVVESSWYKRIKRPMTEEELSHRRGRRPKSGVVMVKETKRGKHKCRRITKWKDNKDDGTITFITNNLDTPATVICETYRRRWQIETLFYEKYIVMRSERESSPENQVDTDLLLRSTSHNDNHFLSPLSQSRRFLLDSQDLSGSRLGVRSVYAFSKASRFAFESARAYMSVVCIETCPRMSRI